MTAAAPIDCVLCRCHGEIDGVLDLRCLRRVLEDDPRTGSVIEADALCLPEAVAPLAERIGGGRGKVLLVACAATARGDALIEALAARGIDPSRLLVVDIREGCAWIHARRPDEAVAKAADILRMGLAALAGREDANPVAIAIHRRVLVVGGGPAGLAAAAALGRADVAVDLVESSPRLGGMLNRLFRVAPGDRPAIDLRQTMVAAVEALPRVRIRTGTRVTGIQGACGDFAINLAGPDGSDALRAGAVILATGAMPALPARDRYGYGRVKGVVSGLELEKTLRSGPPPAGDTVFIQCVEVRNPERPYCSAVCCPAALKNALLIKRAHPAARVAIVHRDIMSVGRDLEAEYRRAAAAGVLFVRFDPAEPPAVEDEDGVRAVTVKDQLAGTLRRLPATRVVLSTPLAPRPADRDLPALGLEAEGAGFHRVAPFLHSLETAEAGVLVCGAARWPVLVDEAVTQGRAAAAKALGLVARPAGGPAEPAGFQARRVAPARVAAQTCTGCGHCQAVCPAAACRLEETRYGRRAAVDPVRCTGCGACAAACPNGSIDLPETTAATLVAVMAAAFGNPSAVPPEEKRAP